MPYGIGSFHIGCQDITSTNAELLLIGLFGTNLN